MCKRSRFFRCMSFCMNRWNLNVLKVEKKRQYKLTVNMNSPVLSNSTQYTADRCPTFRLNCRICEYILTGTMWLKVEWPHISLPRCTFTRNKKTLIQILIKIKVFNTNVSSRFVIMLFTHTIKQSSVLLVLQLFFVLTQAWHNQILWRKLWSAMLCCQVCFGQPYCSLDICNIQ